MRDKTQNQCLLTFRSGIFPLSQGFNGMFYSVSVGVLQCNQCDIEQYKKGQEDCASIKGLFIKGVSDCAGNKYKEEMNHFIKIQPFVCLQ